MPCRRRNNSPGGSGDRIHLIRTKPLSSEVRCFPRTATVVVRVFELARLRVCEWQLVACCLELLRVGRADEDVFVSVADRCPNIWSIAFLPDNIGDAGRITEAVSELEFQPVRLGFIN